MGLKHRDIILPVTLFYDGSCPLCMREMRKLHQANNEGNVVLEDIRSENFSERFPELEIVELDKLIHARLGDGQMLVGVDANLAAWMAVGKGYWMLPLRWPGVRLLADWAYRGFARNRHWLSRKLAPLLGKNACKLE